ncbi:MAG: N-acetyl-D-Glu racemase DgcA [Sedimenticolaceae bacterium]
MVELVVSAESWPIRGSFTISRGAKTQADVVLVELSSGEFKGRGECVPYTRYGESCDSVIEQIESLRQDLQQGLDRIQLQQKLTAGAARNALDCAFWDLQAKMSQRGVWELLGLPAMQPLTTAYTLSLDSPESMHKAALEHADRPLLKLKLAGEGDIERVRAVRKGAPKARLIVDANEGWDPGIYRRMVPEFLKLGVEMIEQPLPAADDEALRSLERPIPICADESCHESESLKDVVGKYDMVNIKLDKAGGLTAALQLRKAAEAEGLRIMVGCMLATSLAMAPATVLAQGAEIVDLDGPLLLERDRHPGLSFYRSVVSPPQPALWG